MSADPSPNSELPQPTSDLPPSNATKSPSNPPISFPVPSPSSPSPPITTNGTQDSVTRIETPNLRTTPLPLANSTNGVNGTGEPYVNGGVSGGFAQEERELAQTPRPMGMGGMSNGTMSNGVGVNGEKEWSWGQVNGVNGVQQQTPPPNQQPAPTSLASPSQILQSNNHVSIPSPSATPTPTPPSQIFTKPRSGSTSTVVGIPPSQAPQISRPPVASISTATSTHTNGIASHNSASTSTTPPPHSQPAAPSSSNIFPALHLTPMNDTFIPKQISLSPPGNRVKIGRQTNNRTVPNERNGYFDSKVLSRMHAEVWCEDGKVYIKDVKSSNGTFINGERLSPEGVESDVFELHTDDIVEFGIDIVSDDNRTIVHHKVAAKVFLVLNADDAVASSRDLSNWLRNVGESPFHRRGKTQNGGVMTFDQVLSRLQNELQKSREAGGELMNMVATMGEIHETLNGGVSAPPPIHPSQIPPFPPQNPSLTNDNNYNNQPLSSPINKEHAATLSAVQVQLSEAQTTLANYNEKMRNLDGMLVEHETLKKELSEMRGLLEDSKKEIEEVQKEREMERREREKEIKEKGRAAIDGRSSPIGKILEKDEDEDEMLNGLDGVGMMDTVRVSSAALGLVKGGKGINKRALATDGSNFLEPPNHSLPNGIVHEKESEKIGAKVDALADQLEKTNQALTKKIESLSFQLEDATRLSQSLKTEQEVASATIKALEEKVKGLEQEGEKWEGWRSKFEEEWKKDKAGWEEEREKFKKFVQDWEDKQRVLEKERLLVHDADASESDEESSVDGAEGKGSFNLPRNRRQKSNKRRKRSPLSQSSKLSDVDSSTLASDSESTAVGTVSSEATKGSEPHSGANSILGSFKDHKPEAASKSKNINGIGAGTQNKSVGWAQGEAIQYLGAAGIVIAALATYSLMNKCHLHLDCTT